jgi:hypothetical protein
MAFKIKRIHIMKLNNLNNKARIEELLNWLYDSEQKSIKERKKYDLCGVLEMGSMEFGKECAYSDCRLKIMEIFKIKGR